VRSSERQRGAGRDDQKAVHEQLFGGEQPPLVRGDLVDTWCAGMHKREMGINQPTGNPRRDDAQNVSELAVVTPLHKASPGGGGDEPVGLPISELLGILGRYKLLIAVSMLLFTAGGYLWFLRQVPIYEASCRLILMSKAPKILNNVSEVVELGTSGHFFQNMEYRETQFEIIKSREVAERTLDALDLWDSEHLVGIDRMDPPPTGEDRAQLFDRDRLPKLLSSRIKTHPVSESTVIRLSFTDSDPVFATQVINAVAEAYRELNVDQKKRVLDEATKDLRAMVETSRATYDTSEDALSTFETEQGVGTIAGVKEVLSERHLLLSRQLTDATAARIVEQARASTARRHLKGGRLENIESTTLLADPVIQDLKRRLVVLETREAELSSRYLEQHPELLAVRKSIEVIHATVKTELQTNARSQKRRLREQQRIEAALREELEMAKSEQFSIAQIDREYQKLIRHRDRNKELFDSLNKRFIEVTMTGKVKANNIRILEAAVPPRIPIYPKRSVALGAAAFLGLLLGVILAFIRYFADATVKGWSDVEELSDEKVLGVLPVIGGQSATPKSRASREQCRNRDLYIYEKPKSATAEAARTLRTNLDFLASTRPLKSLLITSAVPQEGKSTISVNTAISFATSGRRVLLVEADLRRPRLATSFEVDAAMGLSAYLAGTDTTPDAFLQATTVENLDLLVAGPVPPNPAELLQTERFDALLGLMASRYDLVILDSPPVLAVTDALILARKVDAMLMVVRAEYTSRHTLRDGLRQLRAVQAPLAGIVLNHQRPHGRGYGYRGGRGYGYGYGYGYGHSHGYGYGVDEEGDALESKPGHDEV
jgi:capsular exopolysaccharide synthesis family protein